MFECQYNEEMQREVQRLEAKARAMALGHPEWNNACARCGCELKTAEITTCADCAKAACHSHDCPKGLAGCEPPETEAAATSIPNLPDKARQG